VEVDVMVAGGGRRLIGHPERTRHTGTDSVPKLLVRLDIGGILPSNTG
jgi:hypothetical protein